MTRQVRTGVVWAVLVLVGLLALSPAAYAEGLPLWPWYSLYPADFTPLYRGGQIPAPPYFAIHPPVYYSVPVPRTYGYSPYAYPPYMTTPAVELPPVPKTIPNKYVPQKGSTATAQERVTHSPLKIVNPYVIRVAGDEQAKTAEQGAARRKAQIVYPIAAFEGR